MGRSLQGIRWCDPSDRRKSGGARRSRLLPRKLRRSSFQRFESGRGRWRRILAGTAAFCLLLGALGASLASLSVVGGTTNAAGGAQAPASWIPADVPVTGLLPSEEALPGTSGTLEYAYGINYGGATVGTGSAMSGAEVPGGVIRVLEGDTLTGSVAVWQPSDSSGSGENSPGENPAGASGEPASGPAVTVSGVAEQSPNPTLGGHLTVTPLPSIDAGASRSVAQARWQIAHAAADTVNNDGQPSTLQVGAAGTPDATGGAAVRVFVVDPRLDETLEVCTYDSECNEDAPVGDGGWTNAATLNGRKAPVRWRVSVTNVGNVDLTDVRIATQTNDTGPLYTGDGVQLGDIPAGGVAHETFTSAAPDAGDIQAEVAVSGVFTANAPDGTDLASRFTDTAGTQGRVPSNTAHATVTFNDPDTAPAPAPATSDVTGSSAADAPISSPTADAPVSSPPAPKLFTLLGDAIMPWSFSLAVVSDPAGYGGKAVYTGTASWDANSNPGYDANASNNLVRSNDLVMYSWSIAASQQVSGGATSAAGTVFEQTITMQPGAVVNFSVIPAVCGVGSGITANPSGVSIGAKEIPPAGTTSVVLSCELGNVASGARLLSTQVWVAPDSKNASVFSSTARVYTHDSAIANPVTLNPALPVTVSAAPLWDVSVAGWVTYGGVLRTFNGVDNTMVEVLRHSVSISTNRVKGVEALTMPITMRFDQWATYTNTAGSNGTAGNAIANAPWQIDDCFPTFEMGDNEVLGVSNDSFPNSTTQQGGDTTCGFTRANPADLNSSYTLTLSNLTQNGAYPTESIWGGNLLGGPYYSATFEFETLTPLSVLDAAVGAASDGAGQATLYSRVSGFDPNGVSGQSNYGAGTGASAVEPGYCSATASSAIKVSQIPTYCANMPGGARSNDVSGPFTVEISPGSWAKYLVGQVDAWTVWDSQLPGTGDWSDGNGKVAPGQTFASEQVLANTGSASFTGAQMCDVFDNTVVALSPLKNLNDIQNVNLLPDNLYSYVLSSSGGSVADQQAFNQNFTIEFAHVNVTGDDPYQAWDAANDRYKGTWTAQATTKCSTVPSGNWKSDPTQVSGGLNAVNIVRVRQKSSFAFTPGTGVTWWLAFTQRDTFNGGPHAGTQIPAGVVNANFGAVRTDQWNSNWGVQAYVPGAGNTYGVVQVGENGDGSGDRWTVVRSTMTVSQQTVAADVGGVMSTGAAAPGVTGTAENGKPVVWEVQPSVNADFPEAAAVEDVTVVVTLPHGLVYDEAGTSVVEGGTLPDTVVVNPDGTTTLTWLLGSVTPNTALPPIRYVTSTDPFLPDNTVLTNTARVTGGGIAQTSDMSDTQQILVQQTGALGLAMSLEVASAWAQSPTRDHTLAYTARFANLSDSIPMAAPTFYDVLPYNGDGTNAAGADRSPASNFHGTEALAGPPAAYAFDGSTIGTTQVPGTFYYTTIASALVPQDIDDDTDPSIWTTVFPADGVVTGMKFVAANPLGVISSGMASGIAIQFTTDETGNAPYDQYANRFTLFSDSLMSDSTHQQLISNQTLSVTRSAKMFVQKVAEDTNGELVPMSGSQWSIGATDGTPDQWATVTPVSDGSGGSVTGLWEIDSLSPGTYWLIETTAPAGFNLLARPVQIEVDDDGNVTLGGGAAGGALEVASIAAGTGNTAGSSVVTVRDVPAMALPAAGGPGNGPVVWSGLLLVGAGVAGAGWTMLRRRRMLAAVPTAAPGVSAGPLR